MIGVIITFYKNEPHIRRCLNSLLEQSHQNYHLFLVDDGSPDDCGCICDEYALAYQNISVIHQTNQGVSAARNSGIEAAMNNPEIQWITFVDGDDWVHHDYLDVLYYACVNNGLEISISGMFKTEMNNVKDLVYDGRLSIECPDNLCNHDYFDVPFSAAGGKLYSRNVIGKIRFPIGKTHEDEYTNWKWLFSVKKVACILFPLYYYYTNDNGIMNSKWSIRRMDMLPAFREQLAFYKNNHYYNMFNRYIKEYYNGWLMLYEKMSEDKKCKLLLKKDLKLFLKDYSFDLPSNKKEWLLQLLHPKKEKLKSMIKSFVRSISEDGLVIAIKKAANFVIQKKN